MKKLILALVFVIATASSFAGYSGGGGTVSDADLATKLDTSAVVQTTGTNTTEVMMLGNMSVPPQILREAEATQAAMTATAVNRRPEKS
jgi:hypothetical protein